ncbi:MAG: hypothetical protein QNJ38_10060 [Prochloraceae cyanobacterium]|nr:hypothetical protein [Prochloraceae cyanobacterium]
MRFSLLVLLTAACFLASDYKLVVALNRSSEVAKLGLVPSFNDSKSARNIKDLIANKNTLKCGDSLEDLTVLMLKDLPSYANRVIARSTFNIKTKVSNYVIVAGKPEYEPIILKRTEYNPVFEDKSRQVFFTTLEKKYIDNKPIEIQNYHWLFLTQSQTGWRMVTIFSRLGQIDREDPPLPREEASSSYIGRAIKLWLRDCRAGVFEGDRKQ